LVEAHRHYSNLTSSS